MLCEGAAADWAAVYLHASLREAVAVAGLGYTLARIFGGSDRPIVERVTDLGPVCGPGKRSDR